MAEILAVEKFDDGLMAGGLRCEAHVLFPVKGNRSISFPISGAETDDDLRRMASAEAIDMERIWGIK